MGGSAYGWVPMGGLACGWVPMGGLATAVGGFMRCGCLGYVFCFFFVLNKIIDR